MWDPSIMPTTPGEFFSSSYFPLISTLSACVGQQMKVSLKFSFKNTSSSRIATFAVLSLTPNLSAIAEYLSWLDKYHNIMRRRSYSVFGLLPPIPCLPTIPAIARSKQIRRIHSSKCSTTVRVTRKNTLNSSARNRLTTLSTYPCWRCRFRRLTPCLQNN